VKIKDDWKERRCIKVKGEEGKERVQLAERK
jgi:hypothetical protein